MEEEEIGLDSTAADGGGKPRPVVQLHRSLARRLSLSALYVVGPMPNRRGMAKGPLPRATVPVIQFTARLGANVSAPRARTPATDQVGPAVYRR